MNFFKKPKTKAVPKPAAKPFAKKKAVNPVMAIAKAPKGHK
jgi:hypothetical protein